jgi:subtilase family serine protease
MLAILVIGGNAPVALGASQAPRRLHSDIDDSQTFVLKGNTRPAVELGAAQDLGEVSASQTLPRMAIHFAMSAAQHADLAQLLAQQQDRRSAQFHKFLTPESYAARFGLNTADLRKITLWLENNGFSNLQVARSRTWVSFSGTAAQAQAAFHTAIHSYAVNGETHFANASDPQLPKALQGVAESVRGLHDFRMKPHIRRIQPHFTSNISGNTFLAPDDWATIYDVKPLYGLGLDGTGVTIAVVGQSDVLLTDIRAFRSAAGLPAKDPTIVLAGRDPGVQTSSGDEGESDLDLEWSGAIAKNANILFVTASFAGTGNGVEDSITYVIDNNVAPILSTSYGLCEANVATADLNTQNALFAQANAQGMTILAASGDGGAADCDPPQSNPNETAATQGLAVDFPASSPYVTGMGGTTFSEGGGTYWATTNNSSNGSALSYIPEVTWNDTFKFASGGGASALVPKPVWQTGTGVPADTARDVPDLAVGASPAHDGYMVCSEGSCVNGFRRADQSLDVTGGTSVGPPTFAGVLALLLQKNGPGSRVGNINANLYALAAAFPPTAARSSSPFQDITSGNNIVPCATGTPNCPASLQMGYTAGVGYDQVTGLGSIDANNLVQDWSFDFHLAANTSTLSIPRGSSSTATATITAQDHFAGTVSFTCSVAASLTSVTCSIPGTVSTSGTVTLTITAGSTATSPLVSLFRGMPPPGLWWLLLPLTLAAAIFMMQKQRPAFALSAVAFVLAIGAVSCGGSSSGTTTMATAKAETGVVTVTATSGQLVNTTSVSVTVQ